MNYTKRRTNLVAAIDNKNAVVAVSAAHQMQRSNDVNYPYRQDSNFRYLCGYDAPQAILIVSSTKSILFVQFADDEHQLWEGATDSLEQIQQQTQVDEVQPLAEFDAWLAQQADNTFYVPRTVQPRLSVAQLNAAQTKLVTKLQGEGVKNVQDLNPQLVQLRKVKDANEIELLDRAAELTLSALAALDVGAADYEYQLAAQLNAYFGDSNRVQGYLPIVAAGVNSTVLHYTQNNAKLPDNGLVLLDVGAEIDGYTADISRTIAVGTPSKRQQQLVAVVEALQQRAIARVKPGVTIREVAGKFRQDLLKTAQELELLGGAAELEDTIELMPHGLSHYLGLDVHDAGDYEQPLEPGVVLTVEPGIYLSDEGIGVRIEDDVVVTDNGCRVLGQKLQ